MPSHQTFVSRTLALAIFLFTVATFAQSQTPDSLRKPAGSISGRVTLDGKPAVSIFVAAVAGQTLNRRDAAAHTVTDADGHYVISGLAAGQYQVWTLTPNMVADPSIYDGYSFYFGAHKSLNLEGDEQVSNIDLKLVRGAVITGRVTNSENKPIVGEAVTLQLLDQNGNPRSGAVSSPYEEMFQTDDRGIYRIYGLEPGRYRVSAGQDPANERFFRAARYEQAFYLDPADQSKPGIVELTGGAIVENIDIRVQPAPPTFSIAGRVIDKEKGAAIPRAGVIINHLKKDGGRVSGLIIQADDRGQFTHTGLSAGLYDVTPTSEFYGGNFYGDPVQVELVDKDVTGVEIKTTPGLSISGVVVAEGLSTQELLAMLPGLEVGAFIANATNQGRASGRVAVAPDGSFQVDGLRPGKVSIGLSTQRPPFVRPQVNHMERAGVPLTQNFDFHESMSGLRLIIDYGTGTLRGTIKFEGDATVEFSRIYVSCKREGASDGSFAQVDTRGHFVISNLAPGPYEVTIQAGGGSATNPVIPIPPQKQTVNITNGAETQATFSIDLSRRP